MGHRTEDDPRMDWYKRFKSKGCILKLKAADKPAALQEMVDQLLSGKLLDSELEPEAKSAVEVREERGSTGIGGNVAISHVQVEGLSEALCSLAVSQNGIEWAAVDGAPVQIVFMVLRPTEPTEDYDPEGHIEMMRWVARLARDADFRGFALQAKTKTELVGLLKEMALV